MIKAVIVDDEPQCCQTLVALLTRYCPMVEVVGLHHSGVSALSAIKAMPLRSRLFHACQSKRFAQREKRAAKGQTGPAVVREELSCGTAHADGRGRSRSDNAATAAARRESQLFHRQGFPQMARRRADLSLISLISPIPDSPCFR